LSAHVVFFQKLLIGKNNSSPLLLELEALAPFCSGVL